MKTYQNQWGNMVFALRKHWKTNGKTIDFEAGFKKDYVLNLCFLTFTQRLKSNSEKKDPESHFLETGKQENDTMNRKRILKYFGEQNVS